MQVIRYDCLAIGALGAILLKENNRFFYLISTHIITQLACWLGLVLMAFNKFHVFSIIDQNLVSLITVFLIMNVSQNKKTIINLENRLFNFLGKISYGIYMWHLFIIFILSLLNSYLNLSLYMVYFIVISSAIIIATLSYNYFEKPFLRLKAKYN